MEGSSLGSPAAASLMPDSVRAPAEDPQRTGSGRDPQPAAVDVRLPGDAGMRVPAAALAALPLGLARRVVRAAAAEAGQAVPPAAATDEIVTLATGAVRWPGGCAERHGEVLLWPDVPGAS